MKAARLHAYDEALRVEEVPDPEVTRPFDVIVRVGGAGLCRTARRGVRADHTVVADGYPLDAINDAIADLDAGRIRGRAIIVPENAGR